jgi:hypothetical protein
MNGWGRNVGYVWRHEAGMKGQGTFGKCCASTRERNNMDVNYSINCCRFKP